MKLSIIIPVYNEAQTLKELIDKIIKIDLNIEIIIVDDGSIDGSINAIEELSNTHSHIIRKLAHKQNLGKGEAIKTGIKYVSGDIFLIQDADLELEPQEYKLLLAPFGSGLVEVVYGSRFLQPNTDIPPFKRVINRILTSFTNLLFSCKLTDEATAYKVFKTELIKKIKIESSGFEICQEITSKLLRNRKKIIEVPISYNPRTKKDGKKLCWWKDGFRAIYTLIKYRFKRDIEEF